MNAAPAKLTDSSLPVACTLAAAGAFLDGYTYMGHGHVFANAQTGNVIMIAVSAVLGTFSDAYRYVRPVIAFMTGILVAHRLRLLGADKKADHRVALICLTVEIVALTIFSFLPTSVPEYWFTCGISFVTALQSSAFRQVNEWTFSNVNLTGNLRTLTDTFFDWLFHGKQNEDRRKTIAFASVCFSFAMGAGAGAWFTIRLHNFALLVDVVLLLGLWILLFLINLKPARTA